ncbi:cobaltochelatase subunit CobN [Sulfitobacter mediterraneus]|uniref:cobaltochelatase subunit CobN n=1 Tax=Sulfitobacter mediterraneus TaxID=83219 RepID=UPI001939F2A2|nr:cobaltochelatase subunit CobN [Sulfitobacter mediterraneus]MBM1555215.1 cobaltochelatase subunit CobN [Sulfitobacter mediterraneus]MBM1567232.1 cobaltochelatase subunit CobN [Sulfitobacter mediterraneus]MBM1571034.1 cobaltochelatase subunit CobN [Sulfitobacter mediterraneus]MBM1574834.1 cobaltochelatase subunit CobN [Sulfitobacter mediterraneus]MBM1578173.1 cobaltochelatase subunit CobN [Sulfitobacter mediterraneus]
MHVVFRESHGLEDTETPFDPGQTPADLVVLSFSDSDLGAFAAGWHRGGGVEGKLPTLRLCNLVALRHPASVDNYVEQTLTGAKGILIRLIGGENYWPYGIMQVQDFARRNDIALAILPADGREDPALDAHSTLPVSTLRRLQHLCDTGGTVAAQAALAQLALAAGFYAGPVKGTKTVPPCGAYDPDLGVIPLPEPATNVVAVTFYRSYLTAADTAPIDQLICTLRERGFAAFGLFAPSLKDETGRAFLQDSMAHLKPTAIINATAFSGRGGDGTSPLDGTGCPVFQVALSTARRKDWDTSERGLSPADLAMHVVLPEVDGRIFTGVVSFKAPDKKDPHLQYSRFAHRAEKDRIEAVVDRLEGWHRLARTPVQDRKLALVLSTYPGRADQIAHAVGLDALASTEATLAALGNAGYSVTQAERFGEILTRETLAWDAADYTAALAKLPQNLRDDLATAWGDPQDDPLFREGAFHFPARACGNALVALQPERGSIDARDADYHDLERVPRHSYVAFYLWLRAQGQQALVHIGAHGTLEWLPGKAVALSDECWPEALTGDLPVIYPFIVNDPGEAAQAKRRIGAVTLGHLPPPMKDSETPDGLLQLERLLDEYSTADGLDPARRDRLIDTIRSEAQAAGVEKDLGLDDDASAAEAITRIDRFVCDIKESQYGDGLHIYGAGQGEFDGLLTALDGKRVTSGPSGSPYRGRSDVLPTGRNLYAVDPRSVPSRAAHAQGVKLAEELIRRHLQDEGDYPKGLVIDLWGSATMRTAGEEVAMALHLAGLSPKWDAGSERVSGFEILPLALLNRPRIDVTLRVSGLFRDIFPGLSQLFESGAAALADREEAADMNPYLERSPRVFGPKPGLYGMNMETALQDYSDDGRTAAGQAWLKGSEWAINAKGEAHQDRAALERRLHKADGFAHVQDLLESDVLLASDYASHEGGFAAAMAHLGAAKPAMYHVDSTRLDAPKARTMPEEIARVVRARAANPAWASGMMRHGFRGAAEVAATLDNLAAFAHLTRDVPDHLFDLYYDATLGRDDLVAFMQDENPLALEEMRNRFAALRDAGLWVTRRNSINAEMDGVE